MTKTIDAVFTNGVFRPLQPIAGLEDNERVRLTLVSDLPPDRPFAGWVGTMPDDEAREMVRVIEDEFERVDPDEWK